jgi:hypothetical protein
MTITIQDALSQMAFQNDLLALSAAVQAAGQPKDNHLAEAAAELCRLKEVARKAASLQRERDLP